MNSEEKMDKKVEMFLENLEFLFKQIEEFAKKYNLSWKYGDIEIYEEYAGRYSTKELFVSKNREFIFKIKPIGAYIIGADGRADMIGTLDSVVLIYLERPRFIETKISSVIGDKEDLVSHSKISLYDGFEEPGWYISLEKKKIVPVNEENLCSVLEDISEFRCSGEN